MTPIQIIGDEHTILAFALGGIPGHVARTPDEARRIIEMIIGEVRQHGGPARHPALLLVTAGTAERIRDYLDEVVLDASGPLILEIPGFEEPQGRSPATGFVARVLGMHL
ncbi:MAG TPA: V-type ATP synthase subunit F [Candidatus Acidoferrales bacterium]|nr:V-type ATP synthase subunit F [Candidatus Acidoferrales bacterium]